MDSCGIREVTSCFIKTIEPLPKEIIGTRKARQLRNQNNPYDPPHSVVYVYQVNNKKMFEVFKLIKEAGYIFWTG
jgi:hypothetical protein